MNKIILNTIVITAGLLTASLVNAHDASLHTENAEKPKCEMMEGMDHSNMDPNDPVMQAMMKKCMAANDEETDSHVMGQAADDATKPACTEEHEKMGHCKMSTSDQE